MCCRCPSWTRHRHQGSCQSRVIHLDRSHSRCFIVYAHLGVSETVVNFRVEVVAGVDIGADVDVVMICKLVEVGEGDSVVEVPVKWKIEAEIIFAVC